MLVPLTRTDSWTDVVSSVRCLGAASFGDRVTSDALSVESPLQILGTCRFVRVRPASSSFLAGLPLNTGMLGLGSGRPSAGAIAGRRDQALDPLRRKGPNYPVDFPFRCTSFRFDAFSTLTCFTGLFADYRSDFPAVFGVARELGSVSLLARFSMLAGTVVKAF
jgi:hypothetical protein